jgi:DNA-binding response OmpR family regulator
MAFKILLVDDKIDDRNDDISQLPNVLRKAGYDVKATAEGEAAYDLVWEYEPDLILLDVDLGIPHVDGIDVCEAVRTTEQAERRQGIPIILITAIFTETEDVLRGFEVGADDYVTRPRDWRELLARVRANLPPEIILVDDYLKVDFVAYQVWIKPDKQWEQVQLQPLQFELLRTLLMDAGKIITFTAITERVWHKEISDDALAVSIRRLRQKLETDPSKPKYIETIKGMGYRFNGQLSHIGRAKN